MVSLVLLKSQRKIKIMEPTNEQKRQAYTEELDVLTTELDEKVKRMALIVNKLKESL